MSSQSTAARGSCSDSLLSACADLCGHGFEWHSAKRVKAKKEGEPEPEPEPEPEEHEASARSSSSGSGSDVSVDGGA